jgi:hypothetical protein
MISILPIVEGQSEESSVPILLRRIQNEIGAFHTQIARPFRIKRNKIVHEGELERAINFGVRNRENIGAILVLLDADDDCPAFLGTQLKNRGQQVTNLPLAVVIANKELECWFLGGKESLRGIRSIRQDASPPPDPESIRGAKERLTKNMHAGARYIEVDDQPAFAEKLDFELTKSRCPSFDKFLREAQNLINLIQGN